MGVVYRARDHRLNRQVALKLIAPELVAYAGFRERFLVESRLAAALEHPNAVPIYSAGEWNGQLYIAMRYVDGSDLKRVLEDGRLTPERTIAICSQIAGALDAAHAQGLVHRDVKPSNVLIDVDDRAYLVDFGLTRLLSDVGQVPVVGTSLGTSAYVSPEQIRGDRVDGRADEYSLGCIVHECLTGSPPYRGSTEAALLFAHLEASPPAPRGLEQVMARALAKQPDDRYATCEQLVDETAAAIGVTRRHHRRWPFAVALVAAIAVVALAVGVLTHGGAADASAGGRLTQIDAATNAVTHTISIGPEPTGVAAAGGRVWATSAGDGSLWLVTGAGGSPRRIPMPNPHSVAATDRAAFVVNDDGLKIVKPVAGSQIADVRLPEGTAGERNVVAASGNRTWFAGADSVFRVKTINGFDGAPGDMVAIPSRNDEENQRFAVNGIAVGAGGVWVVGDAGDRSLWRVVPGRPRVAATIPLPSAPGGVAAGFGHVWVTQQITNQVLEIDPAAPNQIIRRIPVGRGPVGITIGAGSVWVANAIDGSVSRINPATGRVTATVPVGGTPTDIASDNRSVWVAGDAR
jgi:serine/threonine-protein kinase